MRLRRLLLSAEERGGNPRREHGGISACCLRIAGQLYQYVNQKNLRAFVCFLCVHFISALCGKKCASSYGTQPFNSTHEPERKLCTYYIGRICACLMFIRQPFVSSLTDWILEGECGCGVCF